MRKEHSGLSTPKLAALLTKSAAAGYLTQKNDLSSQAIGNPQKHLSQNPEAIMPSSAIKINTDHQSAYGTP